MPQPGYRARPARAGAAGYVVVLSLGVLLLLASLGGGFVLAQRAGLVPGSAAAQVPVADVKQVCTDVLRHQAEYKAKYLAIYQRSIEEAVAGDSEKAEKTIDEALVLPPEWKAKLSEQAAKTDDPGLQKVINDMIAAVATFESEDSTADTEKLFADAEKQLDQYCA